MEKKNPFITTIGFKKDDPDHVYVAELLNSMGRGKAQYIVKAVLVYQKMLQEGELPQMSGIPYDYEVIRKIVMQVLEERDGTGSNPTNVLHQAKQETEPGKEHDLLQELDDALSGIMESLMAFQEQ